MPQRLDHGSIGDSSSAKAAEDRRGQTSAAMASMVLTSRCGSGTANFRFSARSGRAADQAASSGSDRYRRARTPGKRRMQRSSECLSTQKADGDFMSSSRRLLFKQEGMIRLIDRLCGASQFLAEPFDLDLASALLRKDRKPGSQRGANLAQTFRRRFCPVPARSTAVRPGSCKPGGPFSPQTRRRLYLDDLAPFESRAT